MKRKLLLFVSLVLLLAFSALGVAAQTNENIVDITARNNNFSTLHAAIVAAGLADTLASADSAYTVFAPTDAAFQRLEAANPGVLDMVMADPDGLLTTILTYHVVPGTLSSDEVLAAGTLTSLQGGDLAVTTRNENVFVGDARVTTADIEAKNGVIHVINTVLLPDAVTAMLADMAADTTDATTTTSTTTTDNTTTTPAATTPTTANPDADEEAMAGDDLMTIAAAALDAGQFTTLLSALESAGLAETFALPGNYTVFAPTDEAFAALGELDMSDEELKAVLLYHVVNDRLTRDQLATDDLVPTLSGGRPLFINRDGPQILNISGAKVIMWDIPASNGVIHVIDRVMIP